MNFKEFLSLNESVLSLDKMFDMTKLKTYKSSDGKLDSVKTNFFGDYYAEDGKTAINFNNDNIYIIDTSKFGKNGKGKYLHIFERERARDYLSNIVKKYSANELLNMSVEDVRDEIEKYNASVEYGNGKASVKFYEESNTSSMMMNPFIMQKNVKSPGKFEKDKKITKAHIAKVLMSGDFISVSTASRYTDDYQYDVSSNFGAKTHNDITEVLDDVLRYGLYYVSMEIKEGYEFINFNIHSNLSYSMIRKH